MVQHFGLKARSWSEGWGGAVALLLFGCALLWFVTPIEGGPSRGDVAEATGQAASVQGYKSGVYFSLAEAGKSFVVHSTAGGLGRIHDELAGAGRQQVSVKYSSTKPVKPWNPDGTYYTVLAVRIGDQVILSEEDVRAGHARNNQIGAILAALAIAYGVWRAAWLKWKGIA